MRMAYFLLTVGTALATFAACAEARPGPGMLSEVPNGRELLNFSSEDPQPAGTEIVQLSVEETGSENFPEYKKVDDAVQLKATDTQAKSDTEEAEEDDVVCTEMGTCIEKRLLTATIDYKNDGPNNPITDPPH